MNTKFYLRGPRDVDRYDKLNPTVEEVVGAINALEGVENSAVLLKQKDPKQPYLGIGGGTDGMYVVFLAVDGEWAEHVVNPEIAQGQDEVRINCAGQKSDIDLRFIVDKDAAIMAAEYFYEHQKRCPELVWQRT